MSLHWLPVIADFRGALRAAVALTDASQRLEALARLAQHRVDVLQTIQLNKAIGDSVRAEAPAGWTRVKLALLASNTVEHLLPGIRVAGLRRRILVDTYLAPYGQYRQELADPGSGLFAFAPQTVVFAVTPHDVLRAAPVDGGASAASAAVTAMSEELRALWQLAQQAFQASVIQQTFLDVTEPLFGNFDALVDVAPARIVARLNERIAAAAGEAGVLLLDIARAAARDGRDNWFESAHWYASKLQIAPRAAALYGEHLLRIVAARLGLAKKCLVLDLDNTLWGGVVGDDGVQGLVLGQGSALGEAHLALQQYAKQLRERGVILAVCSKNERATAEEVFNVHPEMVLKLPDIAAFVANWEDKAENLKAIAQQLNIGLDSLVFLDDNPAERERVRGALPQVSVPEVPEDVTGYVRSLADGGYFEAVSFTAEDRSRGEQYAANSEREALRGAAQSMQDFRRDLAMTLPFGPFAPLDHARVSQLINKTNQFNVTGRKYSQQEVAALASDAGALTLQFRLNDRFGENGIISVLVCRGTGTVLELDTWVMSCRVFGRDVELEIMNQTVDAARQRQFRTMVATYVHTAKNGLLRELFPRLGFTEDPEATTVPGQTHWKLHLADYVRQDTHIKPEATPHD